MARLQAIIWAESNHGLGRYPRQVLGVFQSQIVARTDRLLGHRVGIVANQIPVINADEAMKGATFIRLCNQE